MYVNSLKTLYNLKICKCPRLPSWIICLSLTLTVRENSVIFFKFFSCFLTNQKTNTMRSSSHYLILVGTWWSVIYKFLNIRKYFDMYYIFVFSGITCFMQFQFTPDFMLHFILYFTINYFLIIVSVVMYLN